MLEAAYPHKFLFEYQNLYEPSRYSIVKTDAPLNIKSWETSISEKDAIQPNIKIRNQRQFEVIDLDPLLDKGKGFVRFDAEMTVPSYWDKGKFYTQENCTSIQVTDLGITVRYGVNKAVVLVTSLASGNPVEGANVYMYSGEHPVSTAATTALGSGTTDKNGLAVLQFDRWSAAFLTHIGKPFMWKKTETARCFIRIRTANGVPFLRSAILIPACGIFSVHLCFPTAVCTSPAKRLRSAASTARKDSARSLRTPATIR